MTPSSMNAWLAGFFALAAIHYAIQWWFSRSERVLLVFAIQCALYTAFCWVALSLARATTIPDVQLALDRLMTLAPLLHIVILQFFVYVSGRRDLAFRAVVTVGILALVVLNQWMPLRGTVIALQPTLIRTPPGAALGLCYVTCSAVQAYGFLAAGTLWRRDRAGAILIAVSSSALLLGTSIGILVDFARLQAPYPGALPHTLFVLCMALFLSREYSGRGARVEAAFEHSLIGKALVEADGRLLRVNGALCRMLGSSAEDICARRLYEFLGEDDAASTEVELRRVLTREVESCTMERALVPKGRDPVWAQLLISLVPDVVGKPLQMIVHFQDVTEVRAYRTRLEELVTTRTRELREAKDEAERANDAKSRFLAHMSHEIRSPLHVMVLNAQLLERTSLDAAQRTKVETVEKSGKHLTTLVNNVLEMSTIEAGRVALVEEPFDISVIIDEVAQMFAAPTVANETKLEIERAGDLPRSLLADGGKVKQILINLVNNAVKFTQRGSIHVRATWSAVADSDTAVVEVVVTDTGIGIAEKDLPRVFQPFEQLDSAGKDAGTGLGLAISRVYARLLGGDIQVTSTPNVGSSFELRFTAKRVEAARAPDPKPAIVPASKRWKVLIVDDVDANRTVVADVLSGNAFETRTAVDGHAALSIDADWRPDVVLMDLRMPGMNGLEAIRRLRATGSKAVIGALTAGAFGDDKEAAFDAGADFFMRKPFDDRELLEGLARALGRHE